MLLLTLSLVTEATLWKIFYPKRNKKLGILFEAEFFLFVSFYHIRYLCYSSIEFYFSQDSRLLIYTQEKPNSISLLCSNRSSKECEQKKIYN